MTAIEATLHAARGQGLRFSGDVLLWDADDPAGVTVLRAASRSLRLGKTAADWFAPQELDELRFWGRMRPQARTLSDGTVAHLLPLGAVNGAVWLVLPDATQEEADAWWALLSPKGLTGDLADGDDLADAFDGWLWQLAQVTGCGLSLDVSGLRGQGWVLPFSADTLIGALVAAMLEARICAADRSLSIRLFAAAGEGVPLLHSTLALRGAWPENPLWLRLAEGGSWQITPESADRPYTVHTLRAVHLRPERVGLKNPLPWRG